MKKLTSVYLLLLLALYPLYYGAGGYRTLENDKYIAFLMLGGMALLLLLSAMICKQGLLPRKLPMISFCALFLLAALVLSAVCSEYPTQVWLGGQRKDGVLTWAIYLLIFAVAARWGKLTRLHDAALTACLGLTAVLCFIQKCGENPLGLYPDGYDWLKSGKSFLSTLGNVDFLSAFAVLTTMLLLGRYTVSTGRLRWIPLLGAAFGVVVLYLGGAKAAKLGLYAALLCSLLLSVQSRTRLVRLAFGCAAMAAALAVLACLGRNRMPDGPRIVLVWRGKVLWRIVIALGCVVIGLAAKKLRLPSWLRQRKTLFAAGLLCGIVLVTLLPGLFGQADTKTIVGQLFQVLRGTATDKTGSGRYAIWQQAIALIKQKLLLGGGPDTMGLRNLAGAADNAHSIFLNLWVNGGLVSLLGYCLLLGGVFLPALRKKTACTAQYLPAVVAYVTQAAVTVDEFIVAPLFWAVLGLLAGRLLSEKRSAASQ